MTEAELIEQYRLKHQQCQYGTSSIKLRCIIEDHIRYLNAKSILDYGCGQSRLSSEIYTLPDCTWHKYDPAIPEYAKLPVTAVDLIICTDVLEHLDESFLYDILERIKAISDKVFFTISCTPAVHLLPNGMNCHTIVKNPKWWLKTLSQVFKEVTPAYIHSQEKYLIVTTYNDDVKISQ